MQEGARKRLASGIRWIIFVLAFVGFGVTIVLLVPGATTGNSLHQLLDNVMRFLFSVIYLGVGVYFVVFGREQTEWIRDMRSRNRWYSRLFNEKHNTPGWIRGLGWFWMVYGALFLAFNLWRVLALR